MNAPGICVAHMHPACASGSCATEMHVRTNELTDADTSKTESGSHLVNAREIEGDGVVSVDELRERIMASTTESVEADVLRRLWELPQVAAARSEWFHGWVEITVVLREWTWNAQAQPSAVIDMFARGHIQSFSVTTRFEPMPLEQRS